ncbi:MAG TPA: agmatine deiminase family protein, partial [Prolixibacteraceae bacterium]|nr:agmatine deiminase family protein [Prolixibacteraceae bacterium]
MKSETEIFFPPEWAEQDAVMLTWPHAGSDWAPMLAEVEKTYLEIAREICKRELLIVVCPDPKALEGYFSREELQNIRFFAIPSNDTWARDHAPIGVFANGKPLLLDFQFNGWGNKFNARLDNQISGELFRQKAFSPQVEYADRRELEEEIIRRH